MITYCWNVKVIFLFPDPSKHRRLGTAAKQGIAARTKAKLAEHWTGLSVNMTQISALCVSGSDFHGRMGRDETLGNQEEHFYFTSQINLATLQSPMYGLLQCLSEILQGSLFSTTDTSTGSCSVFCALTL